MTSCASCGTRQRALEPYGGDRAREGKVVGLQTPSRCAQTDLTTDTRWCAESKGANARGCRCFWPRSEEKKLAWEHLYSATTHPQATHLRARKSLLKPFSIFCHITARNTYAHTLCLSGRVRGAFTEAKRGQEVSCDEVAGIRVKPITLSSACARAHRAGRASERARKYKETDTQQHQHTSCRPRDRAEQMGAHLSSAEHDTISFGLRVGNVNPALAMLPQSHQPKSTSDRRPTAPTAFA
jgi:hypothetical protein